MSEPRADYDAGTGKTAEAMEMLGTGYPRPPRQIETEVSGFYPLFESLVERYKNLITPAVFGVAWRFCQMEDGVCRAALETMGSGIGVDAATVMRHLKTLCNDGYLKDLTPNLRNRPHVYADCGLVVMKSALSAGIAQRNVGIAQSKAGIAQRNVGIAESQLSKDLNKDLNKDSNKEKKDARPDFKNLTMQDYRKIPELRTFIDATGWIPGSFVLEAVYDMVSENNLTEATIKAAFTEWNLRGYNPGNVKGYLDWARDGIPGARGGKSKESTQSPASIDEAVNDFLQVRR